MYTEKLTLSCKNTWPLYCNRKEEKVTYSSQKAKRGACFLNKGNSKESEKLMDAIKKNLVNTALLLLLLLLSQFSRVQLCATPEMAAHQAPPSLGFSRQEHWSGLPFPSPVHESEK